MLNWYKLSAADLIVIYDDLTFLPVNSPASVAGRGPQGMLSIIRNLGTKTFQDPDRHQQARRCLYR